MEALSTAKKKKKAANVVERNQERGVEKRVERQKGVEKRVERERQRGVVENDKCILNI